MRGYQSTLDDYAVCARKAASRIWDGNDRVFAAFALKFSLNERNAVMKRTMPLTSWLGFGLLAAIILGMLWRHGREWEFSCHGIPVSALSPDGQTYRDGNEIDPLTRAIIRSGDEEVISASLYGFLGLFRTFLAFELWSCSRDRKRWALIGALHETGGRVATVR